MSDDPDSRKYYVAFDYWRADGTQGTACTSIMRTKPVTAFEDVKDMMHAVKASFGYETVVIMNWRLFEGQPAWP